VYEEPVVDDWVIIVRLWWEQTDADDVAMRARVTSTVNGSPAGSPSAATTVDGVVATVRAAVERFLSNRPTKGDARG
jgi:hypothetical protein